MAPVRRVVGRTAPDSVRARERRLALGTIAIILALGTATTIAILAGRVRVATGPAPAARLVVEAVAWIAAAEAWLYAVHRALHLRRPFRAIHRHHHLSTAPTPWTALALHPVEALLNFGFFAVLVAAHPVHVATIVGVSALMIAAVVASHVDRDPFPDWWHRRAPFAWLTTPAVHLGHHRDATGNFGATTTIPDRLLGTLVPPRPAGPGAAPPGPGAGRARRIAGARDRW